MNNDEWERRRIALSEEIFPIIEEELRLGEVFFVADVLGTVLASVIVIITQEIDPSYCHLSDEGKNVMVMKIRGKIADLCTEGWERPADD